MSDDFIKIDEDGFPYIDFGNGLEWHMELDDVEGIWKEKATKELRETPENVENAVDELRKLVLADDRLFMPIEKELLLKFLRPCKFYPQSAYEKIQNFYQMHLDRPDIFSNLTPTALKHLTCYGIVYGQPMRDQHGRRVTILKFGKNWDPAKVSPDDIKRLLVFGLEAVLIEPMTQVNGIVNIIDLDGFCLKQALQWTPSNAFTMVDFVLNRAPLRLKAIHIINAPGYVDTLLRIVKPFLNAKLRNRLFIHKSLQSLHKHIDPTCLRKSYGGKLDLPDDDYLYLAKWFHYFEHEFKLASSFGFNKPNKVPVYDGMFYEASPIIKKFKEKEARRNSKKNVENIYETIRL